MIIIHVHRSANTDCDPAYGDVTKEIKLYRSGTRVQVCRTRWTGSLWSSRNRTDHSPPPQNAAPGPRETWTRCGKLLARPAVVAFSPRRGPLTACTRLWPEPETAAALSSLIWTRTAGTSGGWTGNLGPGSKTKNKNQIKTKQNNNRRNSVGMWPTNWR